ncbi:anti-sigma E factor [Vibrio navarrensis]|jgi:sigma-E factor negative regulatory protein RseA|uniref:Anti-sigma-E factor RseA n=1 Tax=Vibrio navarrensis TaxID=29495 RepID=A0A099M067_9VIBR|nr:MULTISPECIES: sigma-E factor negative regulatory protein [Vibrio]EGR2794900.1 anti-sigma E factor [Vibrio navarrensis]EHA1126970.1 anti-sigma E factor [Vibrio navarrensis]EJK2115045.1 sigma-E factor negative regulatory protein [Vibrio navarrensis]EJL6396296.1 sigma-E factor negative regulatory protein [Vibrio navarrensis]EJL6397477.1 sigma-E factor negative regulatory protein [Vibrio navarrensis]
MADKEKLSALMDGETVDLALLREIEQDQDSLDSWRHYHLIGDVMRGEGPSQPQWNIAESVALALEDEPVHSTHQQRIVELSQVPRESQPTPREAKKQLPAWLSQFGQVAIAACVSLAVIIGVQQYGGGDSSVPQAEQLPVLQTIPFAGSAEPVSLTRESVEKSMSDASLQEQRKRVHAMLRDYELQLRLNSDSSMLEDEQLKSEIE